jgi:uncharacterized Tic20 family protein
MKALCSCTETLSRSWPTFGQKTQFLKNIIRRKNKYAVFCREAMFGLIIKIISLIALEVIWLLRKDSARTYEKT